MSERNASASRSRLLRGAKKILVVQLGDIGDVVWATPAIRALKDFCPHARVSVLVREGSGVLLEPDPSIDRVFEVLRDRGGLLNSVIGPLRLVSELRREGFDVVFDLRADERGAIMSFLSGAPMRAALLHQDVPFWRNRVFTHLATPSPSPVRIRGAAEHSLSVIREFGVETDNPIPRLWISEEVNERVRQLLKTEGLNERRWVSLNPFSRWSYKEWGIDRWARIIDWLWDTTGLATVIVGSAEERSRAEELAAARAGKVYNLAGWTTLAELAGLLRVSHIHMGVDSAAPHIAAAVGTPTVTIFGPSDWFDWAPLGEGHRVIIPDRECVPCHRKGCDSLGKSRCLEELETEKVQRGIEELLAAFPFRR